MNIFVKLCLYTACAQIDAAEVYLSIPSLINNITSAFSITCIADIFLWYFEMQNVSKPVTLNKLKFSSLPYNKHLINWAKSVCMGESWPLSCVQTHCVQPVFTTSVKISPDRPPARLIRAKSHINILIGHTCSLLNCQHNPSLFSLFFFCRENLKILLKMVMKKRSMY